MCFQLVFSNINAQKKHFIFFQAEEKEPFYLSINNKNYSSSLNGYLLIPRLKNGKYFIIAGFPKEKYPEQKFKCIVSDNDQGFVLKQFGADGWGLFNLVTFTKIMANDANWEKDKSLNDTVKIDDDYATTPTNTSSKETEVKINQEKEKKLEETKNIETTEANKLPALIDSSSTKQHPTTETIQEQTKSDSQPINPQKIIIKTYQKGGSQGIDEIYIDYTTIPHDTVVIFIPSINDRNPIDTTTNQKKSSDTSNSIMPGSTNQYNTSCVQMAEEIDFAKSRKQMSQETTDEKMIITAKKSFSSKCYYVEQIKNLGLLFISEPNKLKFFNMAKPYIYDKLNFASLESQFTMSSIIQQFRKIVN